MESETWITKQDLKVSGIYLITNLVNGKKYVGQAKNIHKRWKEHLSRAFGRSPRNTTIHNAMRKYGPDAWEFSVIEETTDLNSREAYWIGVYDTLKSGYNVTAGGGSTQGFTHSGATKQKIREASEANYPQQAEALLKSRLGSKHTEESKARIREKALGRVISPETRQKMRERAQSRRWVNNGVENRAVDVSKLEGFLNDGWVCGRK